MVLLEPGLSPESDAVAEEPNVRVRDRDFTGGRAVAASTALLAAGAQMVGSPAALVEALRGVVNASLTPEDPV